MVVAVTLNRSRIGSGIVYHADREDAKAKRNQRFGGAALWVLQIFQRISGGCSTLGQEDSMFIVTNRRVRSLKRFYVLMVLLALLLGVGPMVLLTMHIHYAPKPKQELIPA